MPVTVESVILAFEDLMQVLITDDAADFSEVGITMAQVKVLHCCIPGPLHMSALVARLRVTRSTTSGLVEKLVEQDLVVRTDDPLDRRQVVVTLTPAGIELMERFRELNARQLRGLLSGLSKADLDIVDKSVRILRGATGKEPTNPPSTKGVTSESPQSIGRQQAQRHPAVGRRPVHRGRVRLG